MFCEKKKNLSVRRKIFKVWRGGKKNVSVEFWVFGKKKNGNGKKSSRKKNQSFLGGNLKWKILLGSCSLVGLCVNLQVKVTGKKMVKIFKVFFGWVFTVKVAICWER